MATSSPSKRRTVAGASDFDALLEQWRRRIGRARMAVILRRAVLAGLVAAMPLAVLGALDVLPWAVVVAVPLLLVTSVLVLGLRSAPSHRQTARLLDHDLGLAARVGTALELQEDGRAASSPLARRVVQEAADRLAGAGARVTARPAGGEWAGLGATVVALAVVLLLVPAAGNTASGRVSDGTTASSGAAASGTAATRAREQAARARTTTAAALPTTARVTTAPTPTTPTVLTPAARRPAAPIPPALGAQPGAPSPGASADTTTAGLRGGRILAPKQAGVPQRATTDNPAATQGADRGVTPVKQPPGAKRTGSAAVGKGHRGAVGEGAAPLPGAASDKRTGTQTGAGTPGAPGKNAKKTAQEGQAVPSAKNTAGSPTRGAPGTKSSDTRSQGAPGAGGQAGASKGRADPGNQAVRRLKAPGALPLATGFRAGPAPSSGKRAKGTGQGDGRGRGEAERGTSTVVGTEAGATVGFAFPELRTAPGAQATLLLNYFGAAQ